MKFDFVDVDWEFVEVVCQQVCEQFCVIEVMKGLKVVLEEQVKGYGMGVQVVVWYLCEIFKVEGVIDQIMVVFGENMVVFGENIKQWLFDIVQVVIEMLKLVDGSEISQRVLEQFGEIGVDVGELLEFFFLQFDKVFLQFDVVINEVSKIVDNFDFGGGVSEFGKSINDQVFLVKCLQGFLEVLWMMIVVEDSVVMKFFIMKGLLVDVLDEIGELVSLLSGKIKLMRDVFEDLESIGEDVQQVIDFFVQLFDKFGILLDVFKVVVEFVFGKVEDVIDKFLLKIKDGLNVYIKELEKIFKVQWDWLVNLIKILIILGFEVVEQFCKFGFEVVFVVVELVNLLVKELEKLGFRLVEIGGDVMSNFVVVIIQNLGKIENVMFQVCMVIVDFFENVIDSVKMVDDFVDVLNQYQGLLMKFLNLKGVKIDIIVDQVKVLKFLKDLEIFIDLVGKKKIKFEVVIDIIKVQGDLIKFIGILKVVEVNGLLNVKGKVMLEGLIFVGQFIQFLMMVKDFQFCKQFDVEGKVILIDEVYCQKVFGLIEFLVFVEGQGLFNLKGKVQFDDVVYCVQMEVLVSLILGEEVVGKFDVDGSGDFDDDEFKVLFEVLKVVVVKVNKGQFDLKGIVILVGMRDFKNQLGGIV